MCADAKLGRATADARRPTHFRVRAREARAKTRRRRAAGATRKRLRAAAKLRLAFCILGGRRFTSGIPMRPTAAPCISGGRGFNPADKTRAVARCLSRWFTRAKLSPFARSRRVTEGGTVNRPSTHVTCRKQTFAYMQGRNFPVQFLSPVSPRILRAVWQNLPGVPETLRVLGWLPGTVNRVETHVSHRKQTIGHASTRNVPAHGYLRVFFARVPALAGRGRRQIAGETPAPQGQSRSLTRPQNARPVRDDSVHSAIGTPILYAGETPGGKGCCAKGRSATFKPATTEACATHHLLFTTHQSPVTALTCRGRGNFPSRWGNRRASGSGRGPRSREFCRRRF